MRMPSEKAKLYIDRLGGGGTPELARDIETAFRIVEGFKAKAAKIKSDTSRTAAGHGIEIGRVFSGGYLDHLRQLPWRRGAEAGTFACHACGVYAEAGKGRHIRRNATCG
jgi:hypothetical protein